MKRTKSFLIICCSAAVVTWLPISASTAEKSQSIKEGQISFDINPDTKLSWSSYAIQKALRASIDIMGDEQGYKAGIIKHFQPIRGQMTWENYYDLDLIRKEELLMAMAMLPETFSSLSTQNPKIRHAIYNSFLPALQNKGSDMDISNFINATAAYSLANGFTKNSPEMHSIFGGLYPIYKGAIFDYLNKPKNTGFAPDILFMNDLLTGWYLTSPRFTEKSRDMLFNVFKFAQNRGAISLSNLHLLKTDSLIAVIKATEYVPRARDTLIGMQPKVRADLLAKILKIHPRGSHESLDAFETVTFLVQKTPIHTLKKTLSEKTFKQLQQLTTASLKLIPNEKLDPMTKLKLSNAILGNPFVTDKKSKEMALESIIEMVKKNKDITEPDSEFVFEISKSFKNISTEHLQHLNDAIGQLPAAYQSKLRKAGVPAPKHDGSTIDPERTDKRELR